MTAIRMLMPAVFALALSAGGCAVPAAVGPPPDPGLLRVGVTPDAPPMVFHEAGAVTGLEADFARKLAETLGRKIAFVELPWEEQIKALDENRIDIIMSAMSVTTERRFRVLFCYPYMRGGLTALVPRDKRVNYLGPLGFVMSRDTVAVQSGTTGDFFVQQHMPKATRKAYESLTDAYEAVASGNADLMIHDAPVLWWLASERPGAGLVPLSDNLTTEYYAWAVRRGNELLCDEVNAVLEQWKADGTLAALVVKWFPVFRQVPRQPEN